MRYTEYAAAERGYEDRAEWTTDRSAAEWNADYDKHFGLDSRVIVREHDVSDWKEAGTP